MKSSVASLSFGLLCLSACPAPEPGACYAFPSGVLVHDDGSPCQGTATPHVDPALMDITAPSDLVVTVDNFAFTRLVSVQLGTGTPFDVQASDFRTLRISRDKIPVPMVPGRLAINLQNHPATMTAGQQLTGAVYARRPLSFALGNSSIISQKNVLGLVAIHSALVAVYRGGTTGLYYGPTGNTPAQIPCDNPSLPQSITGLGTVGNDLLYSAGSLHLSRFNPDTKMRPCSQGYRAFADLQSSPESAGPILAASVAIVDHAYLAVMGVHGVQVGRIDNYQDMSPDGPVLTLLSADPLLPGGTGPEMGAVASFARGEDDSSLVLFLAQGLGNGSAQVCSYHLKDQGTFLSDGPCEGVSGLLKGETIVAPSGAVADLDGDGLPELVLARSDGIYISQRGTGDPLPLRKLPITSSTQPVPPRWDGQLTVGLLNQDLDPDLALAVPNGADTLVLPILSNP